MFASDSAVQTPPAASLPPWRILVVDDELEVHTITRLALRDCEFLQRRVEFIPAMTAESARRALAQYPDVALAFIDVVMETEHAGLDLVTFIRQELGNDAVRLILRTGQPGAAPEREVIRDFDIDDYMAKTSITAGKLYTATISALRAYSHIVSLHQTQRQLERYRDGLETVINASANLFETRSLRQLARGLLQQLGGMLYRTQKSVLVQVNGVTVENTAQGYDLLAKAGRFDVQTVPPLEPEVLAHLNESLRRRESLHSGDIYVGYFPTQRGVNMIYMDGVDPSDEVNLHLLQVFSRNISIAFDKLHLERDVLDTQAEMILTLGDLLEMRSLESGNHVRRVAHLSLMLATALNLPEEDCQTLFTVSPMHDIGKFAIPDRILMKDGPLNDEEWAHMKRHADIGGDVFERSERPMLKAAAVVARQHHERFDGTGYPLGLRGEQIHIFARIVAIVDAFDALLHQRVYKPAWPLDTEMAHLRAERGQHFDPLLVDCFCQHVDQALEIVRRFPDAGPSAADAAPGAASFTAAAGLLTGPSASC